MSSDAVTSLEWERLVALLFDPHVDVMAFIECYDADVSVSDEPPACWW
jgi:hypothetical protein